MHVTACLAGRKEEVEVGEDCRTIQALREAIVVALPQLCVEGFDVSVGGRALDDDGVVSLEEHVSLEVVPNTRTLSARALREAGREVSEAGLLKAASESDVSLCTSYLDAGVAIDCADAYGLTPLHHSCRQGCWPLATLLLDRGSRAIDKQNRAGETPLHLSCHRGYLSLATLLLDRGSRAIDAKNHNGNTPLHHSCWRGTCTTLLLDRGSRAINEKNSDGETPLYILCYFGSSSLIPLLLDRGALVDVKDYSASSPGEVSGLRLPPRSMELLLARGHDVRPSRFARLWAKIWR